MRNVPRDAIPSSLVRRHEMDADLLASSAFDPPAPSELFARLAAMVAIALCFGLSAQFLVGILPH